MSITKKPNGNPDPDPSSPETDADRATQESPSDPTLTDLDADAHDDAFDFEMLSQHTTEAVRNVLYGLSRIAWDPALPDEARIAAAYDINELSLQLGLVTEIPDAEMTITFTVCGSLPEIFDLYRDLRSEEGQKNFTNRAVDPTIFRAFGVSVSSPQDELRVKDLGTQEMTPDVGG